MNGGVVFDAYGTLFNVHGPITQLAGQIGENAAAVSDLWRRKQLEYAWLRTLMNAHLDFWHITQDALDYAMAAHGLSDAALREKLLDLYFHLEAYPDAKACLENLRRSGIKTAILSNGAPAMLDAAVTSSGLKPLLDEVISIEAAGVYKPHPAAYRLAVTAFGLPQQSLVFVSSNGWDVAGAAHFGYQAYHVNRTQQQTERLPGSARASITSLAELAQRLPA